MRIHLIRHGESRLGAGQTDDIDAGLTERGRQQSRCVAQALGPTRLTLVLSSPYRRCVETAEIIRAACGCRGELLPAMHERESGPYPSRWPLMSRQELATSFGEFLAPPGMPSTGWASAPEDRPQQYRRVSSAMRQLLNRFANGKDIELALVTHQSPAAAFVQSFCQWPNPLNVRIHIDFGSLTTLEVEPDGRRGLVRLNWVP